MQNHPDIKTKCISRKIHLSACFRALIAKLFDFLLHSASNAFLPVRRINIEMKQTFVKTSILFQIQ